MRYLPIKYLPLVLVVVLVAFGGWMLLSGTRTLDSKLIGTWTYTNPYSHYPRYSSILTFNGDGTFDKREEFTRDSNSPPIVSEFKGWFTTKGNGLTAGNIAFAIHNSSAQQDGKLVCKSPSGGYTAICQHGFNSNGDLLLVELAGGTAGHEKNPADLPKEGLTPSWESYSKK